MKKYISKIIMLVAVGLAFSAAADAQVYVKIRPPMPRVTVVRPPAPSRTHVWVSGEWQWNNGRYDYKEGYWGRPDNRRHHRWVEGKWRHTRNGWTWVPGHWR